MSEDDSPASQTEGLPSYVQGLLHTTAYPHHPPDVRLIQTHISYVFLAGELVYKTKKPVDFGFIEQLEPPTRERLCHTEVELNRRLAPDVYLGVVPVVEFPDGHFEVDQPVSEGARVAEWAVKMRRLPEERTLDHLLEARAVTPELLQRIVARLVAFHREARRVENDPRFAGAEGERGWWAREYGEAEPFIGDTWRPDDAATLREFVAGVLDREAALFDARLAEGRVVEGHGDLHAKHIYLLDGRDEDLVIVDCIEFNEWFHFRYLDVGYDLAFLAMDLEARGWPDLGEEVAGSYLAATADETFGLLQPLHRAFRAFVRGKVESIGARAPEVPAKQRQELARSAARYFELASTYARRQAAPVLVVLSGLSGSGKSAVGATLAARSGAAYVSSDAVRKALAGVDPHEHVGEGYATGMYSAEMNERTYAEMRRRAEAHLAHGRPVVLDATHGRVSDRRAAYGVARAAGVRCLPVDLRLGEGEALARIGARRGDPLATSDATEEIYRAQVATFEPITHAEGEYLALDATQPIATLAREIAEALPERS